MSGTSISLAVDIHGQNESLAQELALAYFDVKIIRFQNGISKDPASILDS